MLCHVSVLWPAAEALKWSEKTLLLAADGRYVGSMDAFCSFTASGVPPPNSRQSTYGHAIWGVCFAVHVVLLQEACAVSVGTLQTVPTPDGTAKSSAESTLVKGGISSLIHRNIIELDDCVCFFGFIAVEPCRARITALSKRRQNLPSTDAFAREWFLTRHSVHPRPWSAQRPSIDPS